MIDYSPRGLEKRRTRLLIFADILEVARAGAIKTNIMYGASLSFAQLQEYLSFLLDRNLLEQIQTSRNTYRTTKKGERYLQLHKEIMQLLKPRNESNLNDSDMLRLIKNGSRVTIVW